MGKLSLLKEYLSLVLTEAPKFVGPQQPFQLTGGSTPAKKGYGGEYTVYREFPVVPTQEMMQALKVNETDLDENGLLWGEHEIGLDVDMYYEKPERQTMEYPGNPGGHSIDGWTPVTFNGFQLSKEDSRTLQDHMGELTDSEQESVIEQYIDNAPEPDYDDGGYY